MRNSRTLPVPARFMKLRRPLPGHPCVGGWSGVVDRGEAQLDPDQRVRCVDRIGRILRGRCDDLVYGFGFRRDVEKVQALSGLGHVVVDQRLYVGWP